MNIIVQRVNYGPKATEGRLSIDNNPFTCVTLEPFARPAGAPKVQNETAIPAGAYPLEITWSPHFNRLMPLLDNVPNFEAVRIHFGNSDVSTDGCILVGQDATSDDWITTSDATFALLFPIIARAVASGEQVTVTVIDGPGAP